MANTSAETRTFREHMEQVDALLQQLETSTHPASRQRVQNIIGALMDVHGAGLRRILEHIRHSGDAGQSMLDAMTRDEMIAGVLLAHDLHPLDLETRIHQALEKVQPYAASHGGHIEVLGVNADNGVVHLRLEGSCHGCPSSRVTLKQSVEEAIYAAAPEVMRIEVEGETEESELAAAATLSSPESLVALTIGGK